MKPGTGILYWFVLAANTGGLLAYLAWLVFGHPRILYTQDGILYLLPCLPFFFVYFFMFRGGQEPAHHEHDDEG